MSQPTAGPATPRGQGDRLRDDLIEAAVALLAADRRPRGRVDPRRRQGCRGQPDRGVSPLRGPRRPDRRGLRGQLRALHRVPRRPLRPARGSRSTDCAPPGEAYLDFAMEDPGRYRVLFSNPVTKSIGADKWPDVDGGRHARSPQLVALVQACLDAGAQPLDHDATYLAYQIWTWMHGIVDLRITHPMMEFPDCASGCSRDVTRAASRPPRSRPSRRRPTQAKPSRSRRPRLEAASGRRAHEARHGRPHREEPHASIETSDERGVRCRAVTRGARTRPGGTRPAIRAAR